MAKAAHTTALQRIAVWLSGPNARIAIIWGVLSLIFIGSGFQGLMRGQFPDPDDALRLAQIRDLLAGQSWWDVTQYRIDPVTGTQMHWSRLVDLPLALLIGGLTPLLGASLAETVTLIAVPLLTLGVVLFIIGGLARRWLGVEAMTFACLTLGLLAPLVFQLQPMRIDHHGWQIGMVAAALWGVAHNSAIRGGCMAGFAMALGLSISLEILPLVAATGVVLALRWLRDHAGRLWLASYMVSLAAGLTVIFLTTRGLGDLAQYCDAVSPAHLAFFGITALGTAVIALLPALPRWAWLLSFACVGALGIAVFGSFSPTCLTTPFAQLDPVVRDYWYVHISEGRPLWEQELASALPMAFQLLVGLAAAIMLAVKGKPEQRLRWAEYAFLLLASIALALLVWRAAAFAALLAAIPLGWLVTKLLEQLRSAPALAGKLLASGAIIVVLLPSSPVSLYAALTPRDVPAGNQSGIQSGGEHPISPTVADARCDLRGQAAKLNRLPAGTILAPLDAGPSILLESHHSVVATSHHRAEMAMRDVILTFVGPIEDARAAAKQRGAGYILMCSDLAEANLYARGNPDGLAALLIAGDTPDWLEPVPLDGQPAQPAEFGIWKIR